MIQNYVIPDKDFVDELRERFSQSLKEDSTYKLCFDLWAETGRDIYLKCYSSRDRSHG